MGRGRQRAKQAKVARKLKYFSPETDYAALERELSGDTAAEEEYEDPYAHLYEDEEDPYAKYADYSAESSAPSPAEETGPSGNAQPGPPSPRSRP